MKIIIAGGSGFLGNALENFFTEKQNNVIVLTRNPKKKMMYVGMREISEIGQMS